MATIYWLYVFMALRITFEQKRIVKTTRITYHCWTESMILSLVDLQEGQLIPQYYYVSNSNKLVNKNDEERMIIWPYCSGFCL